MASTEKTYLLLHVTYGDFDSAYEEPILASQNKAALELEAAELNAKRTARQLAAEEEYKVSKGIKTI